MRALITGANGFVGKYLNLELSNNGYEVFGIDVDSIHAQSGFDILNYNSVYQAIKEIAPEVVFHLAGQSSVGKSWKLPQQTVEVNVVGTINLLDAVKAVNKNIKVILIGSSDQYGKVTKSQCPIDERTEQHPITPYAISKKTQEDFGMLYFNVYKMNVYMTRSFNHVGIGQSEGFVISDFSKGIAEIESGIKSTLQVGNIDAMRDFTDVRDVVRAYRLILEKGQAGIVYNVGTGTAISIKDILGMLKALSKCEIPIEQVDNLMRETDIPMLQCNHELLTRDTGWEPEIEIEQTLAAILNYYRKKIN